MTPQPNDIEITLGPRAGTGSPPQWALIVKSPNGFPELHMAGPHALVIETLRGWLAGVPEAQPLV
jgi:hypothetical protein